MPVSTVGNVESIHEEPEQSTVLDMEMAKTESFAPHGTDEQASTKLEMPEDVALSTG